MQLYEVTRIRQRLTEYYATMPDGSTWLLVSHARYPDDTCPRRVQALPEDANPVELDGLHEGWADAVGDAREALVHDDDC